jgi:hypothetical protein
MHSIIGCGLWGPHEISRRADKVYGGERIDRDLGTEEVVVLVMLVEAAGILG